MKTTKENTPTNEGASVQKINNITNTKMQISKRKDIIGVVVILAIVAAIFLFAPTGEAQPDVYLELTPQAQIAYDSSYRALCESEKSLAGAKLMDSANGVNIEADLNALIAKRDKSCDFQ